MTRVDFAYGASHSLAMACQTTAKHTNAGHLMYVYCTDSKRLSRFNKLLWEFEPTSFISHCMINDELADHAQVLLIDKASDLSLVKQANWLLNLDISCPPEPFKFKRILEIVTAHESDINYARLRWQKYKELGLELKGHKLRN